ncbi:NAD(P)/FAD-dependent oxidoreductase [Periweissella beninensis]|uniref:NAD(P)/FAD-dependent oxidoreductase n=1 Tax=Periweissella beninensis TaxID=504936 RepID=UPI0021A8E0E3|nr:NAD(P)/FAD-dependent oxidoreductase [Periweissella beninensis]MCT4396161.1 NAD(P)/FAD-dependent oxidoreductase [Periweissella beninensis]
MEEYDLTIIGGGPIGIFAASYANLRSLKVQLIESLEQLGGQITALYPHKNILDVAGYPAIEGEQLVKKLVAQLQQFKTTVKLATLVTDVTNPAPNEFIITTNRGISKSKAVIMATGKGRFEPRRLPFDGTLTPSIQKHIHYALNQPAVFQGKRVLVAGGGDSAVDLALQVNALAKQTYLVHRRDQFRALEHSVAQLKASTIIKTVPYLIDSITQAADGSLAVTLKKLRTDETQVIVVDEIIISYGFISENKMLQAWSVNVAQDPKTLNVLVNQELMTNVAGLFAIGDVSQYQGKTDLIATGFGEGPLAVNAAVRGFAPDQRGPIHSSSLKIANGEIEK